MSSTWFKGMKAFKVEIERHKNYTETNYVLVAETAESNVVDYNGGHTYHEWIYASGNYDEVMREVCKNSINFETGMDQWKPNKKDACGFIKICKKALDNAETKETIPAYINANVYYPFSDHFNFIFDLFGNKPNIKKEKMYGSDVLTASDMKTYITVKRQINSLIHDFCERVAFEDTTMKFKDWIENHKEWYNFI